MNNTSPRVLADVPAWITAGLADMPGGFKALQIYVSTIVSEDDPVYLPVVRFLATHCHRLDSVARSQDESMMFGEADQLIYSIWPGCPEPLVTHGCAHQS